MKKILIIVSAILAMVACEKENVVNNLPDGRKVFQASMIQTKTVMDGYVVKWENGDEISIYNGTSNASFSTTLGSPATTADFVGNIDDAAAYSAMFPASGLTAWSGAGDFTFTIPGSQRAIAGSVDPAADFMVAETTDGERNFQFKHLLGMFKFTIDANSSKLVSIKVTAGRNAAGGHQYSASTGKATWASAGIKEITISNGGAVLTPGDYYLALAAREYDNGLTFTFTNEDGKTVDIVRAGSTTVKAGKVHPMGTVPELDFGDDGLDLVSFTPKSYNKPVYGFYDASAGVSSINWSRITHLIVCSATFNTDKSINYPLGGDIDDIRTLVNTAHTNGVSIILQYAGDHNTIQGKHVGGSVKFYNAAIDGGGSADLATSMVTFARVNGFDGINIFMDKTSAGVSAYPDADALESFYTKLHAAKPATSRTGGAFTMSLCTISEVIHATLLKNGGLDRFVALSGWDAIITMVFGYEVSSNTAHAPQDILKSELQRWLGLGVPASKLIVTIPAVLLCYDGARTWLPWKDIFDIVTDDVATITSKNNYTSVGGYSWIRYDGFPWIGTKHGYLTTPGAGGMALWKVNFDAAADEASMAYEIGNLCGNF